MKMIMMKVKMMQVKMFENVRQKNQNQILIGHLLLKIFNIFFT